MPCEQPSKCSSEVLIPLESSLRDLRALRAFVVKTNVENFPPTTSAKAVPLAAHSSARYTAGFARSDTSFAAVSRTFGSHECS